MLLFVPIGVGRESFAAERLVGLQSAPSIAMALPWIADEARLYSKYDLDFQLVYIASSGIVTAAMSSGNGNVAIVGGAEMGSPIFLFGCLSPRSEKLDAVTTSTPRALKPRTRAWLMESSSR